MTTLADGTVLASYVDPRNGHTYYMDWELSEWKLLTPEISKTLTKEPAPIETTHVNNTGNIPYHIISHQTIPNCSIGL